MTDPMATTTPGTPTQVAHPSRASFRTIAAYVVAGLLVVLTFGPPVIEAFLAEESLPEGLRGGLLALAGIIAAVGGIVTRLMAIPGADRILKYLGLDTGVLREGVTVRAGRHPEDSPKHPDHPDHHPGS